MNRSAQKILKTYLEKKSLLYERALGAEELWQFMSKASEEVQNLVFKLLNEGNVEEAIKIVEKTLGLEEGQLWQYMS